MKYLYPLIFLVIISCKSSNSEFVKTNQSEIVWFKQASVDLGSKIKMINDEFGFAISRGKGENVKGSVLQLNDGTWKEISTHEYSDFPLIGVHNSNTIYWITHDTHHGNYRPRLFIYDLRSKSKKEISLPKIMWDEIDYSMWTGISILPDGKIWLVGQQGNIIHYDGKKWIVDKNNFKRKKNENLTAGDLHDVQMINQNLGWAVGKAGLILKYENGEWKKFYSPTENELTKISMLDENFGWAVGEKGTILKYENNQWINIKNEFRVTLYSVKTLSKEKAWIVGARSTLLELQNGKWVEDKSIKIFDDLFSDVDVVRKNNEFRLWIIGENGIYTNSQNLKFSFTDVTSNLSLRKEGRAAIFRDFDNDGFSDIAAILEDGPAVIYKNQKGKIFSEVERNSVNSNFPAQTISSADFDNDGNLDLLEILDDVNNKLSFGSGNFTFRDIETEKYFKPELIQTDLNLASSQVADFDNDGNLDIYFSNYNYEDMLFKNNGVGKFENVFYKSGIKKLLNHRSYGVTLADFNNDNLIDVVLTYKLPENNQHIYLYLNKGNFSFEEKKDFNFEFNGAPSTYSSIANDFNNDGFTDLIIFNNESKLKFLINDGNANFKDVTDKVGLNEKYFHPEPSGGILAAADVNNDGWLDLFIGSRLFLNSSKFYFTEIGKSVGVDFTGNPTFYDYDNDGDVDLFVGSSKTALGNGERAILYRNNSLENNFIKVELKSDISNRNAIGAKVYLLGYDDNNQLVYKTLRQNGIGSNSISQENFSSIHFGINPKLKYKVKVIFPSGVQKILAAENNSVIKIYESSFLDRQFILANKSIKRTLLLIDWKIEIIKLLFLVIILSLAFLYGIKTKARKYVFHVYFGLIFLLIYFLLIHFTITSPILFSILIPIGTTSSLAFGFIYSVSKYIEKKESNYISHYKILELIGAGGMGKVYKAIDTQSSKIVAIKILNSELLKEQENKRRLAEEGRMLTSINHKNIVKVLEYGETEKHSFIAMEYLSGGTLQSYIERNYPLSNEKIYDFSLQICDGLIEIHKQNIIHRDLKTANIMFDDIGIIRIMDFGLSKSPLVTTMTTLGTVIGTLGFVAPEQVTNIQVDNRVDIFSFGVILYQMTTGKLPFNGENEIALIHAIFNYEPIKPREINLNISEEFESIIIKCLKKNPNERYKSISEVKVVIEKSRTIIL